MNTATNQIKKEILLKAPISRVWSSVSNAEEFGKWFGVDLKGKTFASGKRLQAKINSPGQEHITFDVLIEDMEFERILSFWWHPYAVDPSYDYSNEPTTLVVFGLKEIDDGTLLSIVESGFDKISPSRGLEAMHMNSGGWDQQLKNIQSYLASS